MENFPERWDKVCERLEGADRVLVFTHINMDGDALGSGSALVLALDRCGIPAKLCLNEKPQDEIAYLLPEERLIQWGTDNFPERTDGTVSVAVDATTLLRIDPAFRDFLSSSPFTVKIDHHLPAEGNDFADEDFTDPAWAAACEGMYPFLVHLLARCGEAPDYEIAIRLYTGILTDTGRFVYSSTTPDTMRTVAELLEYTGTDVTWVAVRNYDLKKLSTLKLTGIAFAKTETFCDGRVVFTALNDGDFAEAGAELSEAGAIVSQILNVIGAEIAVFLRPEALGDPDDGTRRYKASLRCVNRWDVSAVCRQFGGGGHRCASGATVTGRETELRQLLLAAAEQALKEE